MWILGSNETCASVPCMSSEPTGEAAGVGAVIDPELVIGVVTPVGTKTADFVDHIRGRLAEWNYQSSVIRLSDHLGSEPPDDHEREDERIHRLINAGDNWCKEDRPKHGKQGLAPLAIQLIHDRRTELQGRAGLALESRPQPLKRHAYIIHSLKRPEEVCLLRHVYGSAFLLFATQSSPKERDDTLISRLSTHITAGSDELLQLAHKMVERDADEGITYGQNVRETYALADVFVPEDRDPNRGISLLFRDPTRSPTIGEYAMYVAEATAARSLTVSRKVGAAIVRHGAIVAAGMNETPEIAGETPDVIAGFDMSEQAKQALAVQVVTSLAGLGVLCDAPERGETAEHKPMSAYNEWQANQAGSANEVNEAQGRFETAAIRLLAKSDLSNITEFQRAVHAEMWAVLDAARRGIALEDATVYCNTYPCHLCWKHLFAVGIRQFYYIKPYKKSRASTMYPSSSSQLIRPYYGIAPRVYRRFFDRETVAPPRFPDEDPLSDDFAEEHSRREIRVHELDRQRAQPSVLPADRDLYLNRETHVIDRFNIEPVST